MLTVNNNHTRYAPALPLLFFLLTSRWSWNEALAALPLLKTIQGVAA